MLVNLSTHLEVEYAVILFFLPLSSFTCEMRKRGRINTVKRWSQRGKYQVVVADVIMWVAFGSALVFGFSAWFWAPDAVYCRLILYLWVLRDADIDLRIPIKMRLAPDCLVVFQKLFWLHPFHLFNYSM